MMKRIERPLPWSLLLILSAVLVGPALTSAEPPSWASSPWAYTPSVTLGFEVTLYETTEVMKMTGGKVVHRRATSALVGVVAPGTPLCPGTTACTLTATGSDNINMGTGLGDVKGTFDVVAQGDNFVDAPELIVMTGKFSGKMDFSPAVLHSIPYGTITGQLDPDHAKKIQFTGTFRLPVNPPVFDLTCLGTNPNPLLCITGWGPPSYLMNPAAFPFGFAPVQPNEFVLGYPMVRFDISF